MITRLNVATIYVLDKDEALDFYVGKLGLEKGNDVQQGDYRWLTVRVPGDQQTEISLERPGPPLHDEATAEALRELVTKGALGGLVFITETRRSCTSHCVIAVSRTSPRSRRSTSTVSTWVCAIPSGTTSGSCNRGSSPGLSPGRWGGRGRRRGTPSAGRPSARRRRRARGPRSRRERPGSRAPS